MLLGEQAKDCKEAEQANPPGIAADARLYQASNRTKDNRRRRVTPLNLCIHRPSSLPPP